MLQSSSWTKYLLLMGLGAFLSAFTVVFGAAPMLVVRKVYGRRLYWLGHLALVAGLAAGGLLPFAGTVAILAVMVGAFSEVEEHSSSVFASSAVALLATLGVMGLALGLWIQRSKTSFFGLLKSEMVALSERLVAVNPDLKLNLDAIVHQMPSALVILLIVSLAVAFVWDSKLSALFAVPTEAQARRPGLLSFRVPDAFVWITMVAILGAFLEHGRPWLEALSLNALNVLAVLYFFQGLAVVAQFFRVAKVGPFWQTFWYFIFIVQLFLFVSFLGFTDFWLDYRDRLSKKSAETNKSF